MNKKVTVRCVLPALTLSLLLSACDGGGGGPVDTSTKVTTLTDSGAGSLRQALTDAKAGGTIRFTTTGTVTLASPLTTTKNVTIDATGVTFDAAGKGRVLEVPAGSTVTIKGGTLTGGVGSIIPLSKNGNLQAQADSKATYGGVILNRGTLTLDGTTVTGGKANNGGGISNAEGASLNLIGSALVTANEATPLAPDSAGEANGHGGGVHNAGTLVIDGGQINANTAIYGGGGIRNTSKGSVTLKNGSVDGNRCTLPFTGTTAENARGCVGGGINSSGSLNLLGGSVSNNTASYFGGGIAQNASCKDSSCKREEYIYPTFTMSGGAVSGNKTTGTVDNGGGGIWLRANATITGGTVSGNTSMYGGGILSWGQLVMTGGTVENNTATDNGGGIHFNIPDYAASMAARIGGSVLIRGNKAAKSGGGVTVGNRTKATMDGGSVTGNTVTGTADGGGGVRVFGNSVLTLSGGEISGNTAPKTGAGLTVGGQVIMTGGSIKNNTVPNSTPHEGGGGVRLYAGSKMTASGGEISGNKARWGAGVRIDGPYQDSPTAEFVLSGATVSGNVINDPYNNGGGFNNGGKLTITAGSVVGNTATGKGGGVWNEKDAVYSQPGGTVSGNLPDQVGTAQ